MFGIIDKSGIFLMDSHQLKFTYLMVLSAKTCRRKKILKLHYTFFKKKLNYTLNFKKVFIPKKETIPD